MSTPTKSTKIAVSRIAGVGLVAIIASVVANVIALFVAKALLPLPADFPPLQTGSVVVFTIIGVGGATVGFAIVSRVAHNPQRVYLMVAIVALILSTIPDIMLLNSATSPFPGVTPLAVMVLILFHTIAAAICIWLFTTKTR